MSPVCDKCFHYITQGVVEQLCALYSNLQGILLLQKQSKTPEQSSNYKTVNSKKLHRSDRRKNLDHFLSEGIMYLNLVINLDECNQNNRTLFALMSKALDIYSRLKIQFRDIEYYELWLIDNMEYGFWESVSDNDEDLSESLNSDENVIDNVVEAIINDENDDDDDDEIVQEEDGHDWEDDVMFDWNELGPFDDIQHHVYSLGKKFHRRIMLAKIESLITRIQHMYTVFIRLNHLLFNHILRDYFDRLDLFLRNEMKIVCSKKLGSRERDICKYILLTRLSNHISEIILKNKTLGNIRCDMQQADG